MKASLTTYWAKVCAPILKARKDELGRGVPEREIAAFVESETGQDSSRSLVSLWLLGEREPTVSQFIALCDKLGLELDEVLAATTTPKRQAAVHGDQAKFSSRKPDTNSRKKVTDGRK